MLSECFPVYLKRLNQYIYWVHIGGASFKNNQRSLWRKYLPATGTEIFAVYKRKKQTMDIINAPKAEENFQSHENIMQVYYCIISGFTATYSEIRNFLKIFRPKFMNNKNCVLVYSIGPKYPSWNVSILLITAFISPY